MQYGELPTPLGNFEIKLTEMMFYQYLPIKMPCNYIVCIDERLMCFEDLLDTTMYDFVLKFGMEALKDSYVYLTAKHLYQAPNQSFNRMGYHSDGFLTDDINYIWCDKNPTIFNTTAFDLSQDDMISLQEMEDQALPSNEVTFGENELLRLNQFNIHKVAPDSTGGMRAFVKVSFSKDKYNLVGNSHNYTFDYDWEMKERMTTRNIPQTLFPL